MIDLDKKYLATVIESPELVMIVNTNLNSANLGNTNEMRIYTWATHSYNYNIDWGDGTYITGYTGTATHVYASSGIYTVKISGNYPRPRMGREGLLLNELYFDRIVEIKDMGLIPYTSFQDSFRQNGFTNLPDKPIKVPSGITRADRCFFQRTVAQNVPFRWFENAHNITTFQGCFGLSLLNNGQNNVRIEESFFRGYQNLTTAQEFFAGNHNRVSFIGNIFKGCPNLTNVQGFANGSGNLEIDPELFNESPLISNFANSFGGRTIPTSQYSQLLINLEQFNTRNSVLFGGGNSKYNSSAVSARNALIARGWTITDGGLE
jgi:hypothetical protein